MNLKCRLRWPYLGDIFGPLPCDVTCVVVPLDVVVSLDFGRCAGGCYANHFYIYTLL